MKKPSLKRERNEAIGSIVCTVGCMWMLCFGQIPHDVVMFAGLGFMAAYAVERFRLYRKIANLLRENTDSASPTETAA